MLQKIEKEGKKRKEYTTFCCVFLPSANIVRMLLVEESSKRCLSNGTVILPLCNAMAFPYCPGCVHQPKVSHKAKAGNLSPALCKHTLQKSLVYKINRTCLLT